jgi:hypothetical protein
VSFGSILVQRDQWDTYGGAKKIIFLIRDIDGPAMTAAPMESCRFAARRSPGVRFGSAVVACKRLHRTRRRLQHILANSLSRQRSFSKFRAGLGSETSRLLHRWRKRCRRLPTTRPTPRGLQEPICPRKKCAIWTRWRPVPVKNVNYPRAPSSRRSGLVGPHTTPAIVNYKYMTSTL